MPDRASDAERDEREMSLVGHLTELRVRLMVSILALVVAMVLAFFVANPVLDILTKPIRRLQREPGHTSAMVIHVAPNGIAKIDKPSNLNSVSRRRLDIVFDAAPGTSATAVTIPFGERPNQGVYFRGPLDPFMIPFRISLIVGILLALPVILYQVWLFIMPGLKPNEKRMIRPLLAAAIFLFPLGAFFGYAMVDMLMRTMQAYQPPSLEPLFDFNDYLSLLTNMMVVFGAVFELPLIVAMAARVGLVTPAMLTHHRRHAWVVLAIAAMIITPADMISMLAALFPLIILYEISIWAARPMARLRQADQDQAAS